MQISKEKYWNTWNEQSPSIMEFLPARFGIKIGAYSDEDGSYSYFPFSKQVRLLEHHPDGDYVHLNVEHAGAVLSVEYVKTDSWTVLLKVKTIKHSVEWGLRYWILVSFGFFEGGTMKYDKGEGAFGSKGNYQFSVSAENDPLIYSVIDDVDSAGQFMAENGIYAPDSSHKDSAQWVANKYNLEETKELFFAVSIANSQSEAKEKSNNALLYKDDFDSLINKVMKGLSKQTGVFSGSIEAVRDVMAWNNLADIKNNRCYTYLARSWVEKMNGGVVFPSDVAYHALMNAWSGDWEMAVKNIQAIMDNIVPAGNFACLIGEYTKWVDRSQPPVISFMILKYYLLTKDKQILSEVYPSLLKAHYWWHQYRDGNKNGVLELGSSYTGSGQFIGTKLAAKNEAAMDNSPMYDKATFNEESRTIDMEDIGLNSLLVLDGQSLEFMARELGDYENANFLSKSTERLSSKINDSLWDDEREIYANRHWDKGFVSVSPTSFYPLVSGIANKNQVEKLIEHMFNENEFWTEAPLPSITKEDYAINDNSYWRGRMWAPLNFFTYLGLKRNRKDKAALKLARKSMEIFNNLWSKERACYENYNTFTGEGADSVDADPFYGWGALLPTIWVFEHIDIDPWNGFHFGSVAGKDCLFKDIKMADGLYTLECSEGITTLIKDSEIVFKSNASGRFRQFEYTTHYSCIEVEGDNLSCFVQFPNIKPFRVLLNNQEIEASNDVLIPSNNNCKIELWY